MKADTGEHLKVISIHALLAESDPAEHHANSQQENFYPRSPCGERQRLCTILYSCPGISIHALLAESDPKYQIGNH